MKRREVERKPAWIQRELTAWLVCWLNGPVRVAFNSRAEARRWCRESQLLTAGIVRVTYHWPPLPKEASR